MVTEDEKEPEKLEVDYILAERELSDKYLNGSMDLVIDNISVETLFDPVETSNASLPKPIIKITIPQPIL